MKRNKDKTVREVSSDCWVEAEPLREVESRETGGCYVKPDERQWHLHLGSSSRSGKKSSVSEDMGIFQRSTFCRGE